MLVSKKPRDFKLYLVFLVLGCQDAEVPFGQSFQPAAKIYILSYVTIFYDIF